MSNKLFFFVLVISIGLLFIECAESVKPKRILVFSKTLGWRHKSIPSGKEAIQLLGAQNQFRVDTTEDASTFRDDLLSSYDAVVFLNTTGDVLDSVQQVAFQKYIQSGGGYVGIHAASDTEYDWPWYGELVGAYFKSHPPTQLAKIRVIDTEHSSTSFLPNVWEVTDEWYNYYKIPQNVKVLATLDESSYEGGEMNNNHPIVWCHEYDGGRAWYTGRGHTKECYSEPNFLKHLLGGILYAVQD